jgi:hypothetical protein
VSSVFVWLTGKQMVQGMVFENSNRNVWTLLRGKLNIFYTRVSHILSRVTSGYTPIIQSPATPHPHIPSPAAMPDKVASRTHPNHIDIPNANLVADADQISPIASATRPPPARGILKNPLRKPSFQADNALNPQTDAEREVDEDQGEQ